MFQVLLQKEKRDDLKEKVEVVFAVFTIAAFASKVIKKRRASDEEPAETTQNP